MRKNRIAVGGMVAADHSASQRITGLAVVASMKVHRCQADTVKVNAANDVYIRSERERRRTEAPIARISSAARSAETGCTSTARVYPAGARLARLDHQLRGREMSYRAVTCA